MNQQPFITLVDQILAAKKQQSVIPAEAGIQLKQKNMDSRFHWNDDIIVSADTSALDPIRNSITGHGQGSFSMISNGVEQQIDEMVYKLYGLTDDEIKIVEGKR